jgi:triphosphatase
VKNAKKQVLAAIGLVRHTLALFGGIVPRKASAHLRDLLTQTETLMLSDVGANGDLQPAKRAAKLALTEFLVTRGWRPSWMRKRRPKSRKSSNVSRISIFPVMPPS